MNWSIIPLPAFKDNYMWTFYQEDQSLAWVVDPGDAAPVEHWLQANQKTLAGILLTHHHHDHSGGVGALCKRYRVPVYASVSSDIPFVTHKLKTGDRIQLAPSLSFEGIEIPGHTLDHLAFYGNGWVFSGDTLFTAGCGRLFEGTPSMMVESLRRLAALPSETLVFCGHEYTQNNLKFALEVEPGNRTLYDRQIMVNEKRQAGEPTVPAPLELEKATNPFLRCQIPELRSNVERFCGKTLNGEIEVFKELRAWKDGF